MINLDTLPYGQVARMAQDGSPALLQAVGRAFGLGADERAALAKGTIPGWFWLLLGIGTGVLVGVRVYKAWPERVPVWLAGEGKRV
jgi:hypothetical protein